CRHLGTGSAVFDARPNPRIAGSYVLPGGQGVIYGMLFSRDNYRFVSPDFVHASHEFARSCMETKGEHLIKYFWGSYVAVLVDPNSSDRTVIRDCSGAIPCYYTTLRGITVVFSDIRHIRRLSPSLSINWKYLAAFLAAPQL